MLESNGGGMEIFVHTSIPLVFISFLPGKTLTLNKNNRMVKKVFACVVENLVGCCFLLAGAGVRCERSCKRSILRRTVNAGEKWPKTVAALFRTNLLISFWGIGFCTAVERMQCSKEVVVLIPPGAGLFLLLLSSVTWP